jgi:lon-related putative ATP-dependent protease
MAAVERLSAEQLYQPTDSTQFEFETTAELNGDVGVVGQERALTAVRFGIGIEQDGYNLYALGPTGLGKYNALRDFIEERAATEPVPPDWVYVNNFGTQHKPNAIRLPAGRGAAFRDAMAKLVDELQAVLPATFESEEYQIQRSGVEEELRERQENAFEALRSEAAERGIALVQTPNGLAFAPMQEGEVIQPQEFLKLPEEEQKRVQGEVETLQEQLQRIMRQVPLWQRETREKVKELKQEVATFAVRPLLEELRKEFGELEEVSGYLDAVEKDIIDNVDRFLQGQQQEEQNPLAALMRRRAANEPDFSDYEVNLLVDNGGRTGAPVVRVELPTYQNLLGRVEHVSQMGALITNYTLIKAGALHEANGGYLLLDARKLLQQPYAYEGLKRALRAGDITIESLGQVYSLISTVSLEPEPVPLDVKVVLLGDRMLYYLLYQHDPEFGELFKVMADFEDEIERTEDANTAYAQMIAGIAQRDGLRPFHRDAVARLLEHASRQVADKERLSTHMQRMSDLMREADFWAKEADHDAVRAADVQAALDAQEYREGRVRERMQESILRETILVDTTGEQVGQINGLAVLGLGNTMFGRPNRITATVRMGRGEVIDIERRVELGGPLHTKGVLILSSFIASRFSAERPFSLNASLVFEQSYGGVDGDSASSAEAYALLSALAQVPIRQGLAVTGSINQRGQVQAIGGVNEKIEGFYDVCAARGLTGDQGVLIPVANVKNLMLRQDVRDAVADGKFHIYPVNHVDEGIELLTGIPAGEPDEDGVYPEGTINRMIVERLEEVARAAKEFGTPARDRDGDDDDKRETPEEPEPEIPPVDVPEPEPDPDPELPDEENSEW